MKTRDAIAMRWCERARRAAGVIGRLARDLGEGAVLWAAFGVALAATLALLGCFSRTLDALSHFAPMWLAIGLTTAAAAFVVRRHIRRQVLVLATIGVAGFAVLMAPELVSALIAPHTASGQEIIKIIQFNAWGGENRDPEGSARWILAQNADFVLMEESDDLTPALTAALQARYPYKITCATPSPCPNMILSRRPLLQGEGYWRPVNPLPFAWGRYPGLLGPIDIVVAHTIWPLPAADQAAHFAGLLAITRTLSHGSLIVGGDFNSTPWSFALRRLDRSLGLLRRTRALPSWPAGRFTRLGTAAPFPVLPIDQIYAGPDWRTVRVERGPVLGSDHYPIVVVLARN
jgi:endonuclease/exonuclease/phosphatase (EEP) superfamily protein YafD